MNRTYLYFIFTWKTNACKVLKKKTKRKRHLGHPKVNGIADHLMAVFLTPYDTAKSNGTVFNTERQFIWTRPVQFEGFCGLREKLLLDASVSLDGNPAESPIITLLHFHSANRVRWG